MVGEVLHIMKSLARDGADHVWFIDEGRIVETGSPDAFFTNGQTDRTRKFLSDIRPLA